MLALPYSAAAIAALLFLAAAAGAEAAAAGRGTRAEAWLNPTRGGGARGEMSRRAALVVPPVGVASGSASNPVLDSCRELAATCMRDNGRCIEAFEELNCPLVLAANSDGKDACACADQCPRGWRCYEYYQALGCYAPPSPCPPKPPAPGGSSEGALIGVLAGLGGAWLLLGLIACLLWAFGGRRRHRHHHHHRHGDYQRLRASAAYASAASADAARRQAHAQRHAYAAGARLRRPLQPSSAAAAPLSLFAGAPARRPPAR